MSVQSWQTTSSGMAVAVYQPASTDCPGDGDPTPCSEKDFGDEELQAIMESLDEQGLLQDLIDDSNASSEDQSQRREQGGWIVQNDDGTIELIRFHEVTGADIEYRYTTIDGVNPNQKPENTVAIIHTHPYRDREPIKNETVLENGLTPDQIEEYGGMENIISEELFRADTRPSRGDIEAAAVLPDIKHVVISRVEMFVYEAEWDDESDEPQNEVFEQFDNCGYFTPKPNS